MPGFNMDDYVPVSDRIGAFMESYPEGSLQSEIVELTESRVTIKAYAYRTPDDPRPGTGHSSLEIPGKTTFTRGSEIENAETSAWGRAIAALGFEVKRGVASREEVTNKQSGAEDSRSREAQTSAPTDKRVILAQLAAEKGIGNEGLQTYAAIVGIKVGTKATEAQLDALIAAVASHGTDAELVLNEEVERQEEEDAADEQAADVVGTSAAADGPEVGADTSPPAEPPQRDTDEYKALDARGKAQARSYWATKELEDRQAPPMNPEPMELAL
jgi:hypothetical protein